MLEAVDLGAGLVIDIERLLLSDSKHGLIVQKTHVTHRLHEQDE